MTAAAAATYALSTPEHGTGVVERTDSLVTDGDIVGAFCAVDLEGCDVDEVDRGITWRLGALDVDSNCRGAICPSGDDGQPTCNAARAALSNTQPTRTGRGEVHEDLAAVLCLRSRYRDPVQYRLGSDVGAPHRG